MQLGIWMVILLAVVQGLTEYLPVSSSGHLVIVETLLGVRGGEGVRSVLFEVAVHVGTLLAVLLFYRRRIGALIRSAWAFAASGFRTAEETRNDIRFILCMIVASLPVAAAGLFLRDTITAAFDSPLIVSAMLVATGAFLLFSMGRQRREQLTLRAALVIGVAQAVALVPGCSRSGWTITTGLLLGLGYEEAAEFSFILSVPAVLGALGLEISAEPLTASGAQVPLMVLGALVAFVSGFVALEFLIGVLRRGRLHRFAYYLIPVGLAMILLFGLSP